MSSLKHNLSPKFFFVKKNYFKIYILKHIENVPFRPADPWSRQKPNLIEQELVWVTINLFSHTNFIKKLLFFLLFWHNSYLIYFIKTYNLLLKANKKFKLYVCNIFVYKSLYISIFKTYNSYKYLLFMFK